MTIEKFHTMLCQAGYCIRRHLMTKFLIRPFLWLYIDVSTVMIQTFILLLNISVECRQGHDC